MAPRQGLSDKQTVFVREYLVDLNATQAALRAGYAPKRADVIGYENLRKPAIADAIKCEMDARAKRTEITADDVLQSITEIRKMAIDSEKLSDALKANELLGKHLKLWTDKSEVRHEGDIVLKISHEDANL